MNLIKRLLAVVSAVSIICGCMAFCACAQDDAVTLGDVDGDGQITSEDALLVLNLATGEQQASSINEIYCSNVDGDNLLTSYDAFKILQRCVDDTAKFDEESVALFGKLNAMNLYKASTGNAVPEAEQNAAVIDFYNASLLRSYNQAKITVKRTTDTEIVVDKINIGNDFANATIMRVVNNIVSEYSQPTDKTQSFTGGSIDALSEFASPARLEAEGAKTVALSKTSTGYEVKFTLVEETTHSLTEMPKYNDECARALDVNDYPDLKQYIDKATIENLELYYPGTQITAQIDAQGRVTEIYTEMPLKGSGTASGTITVLSNALKVRGSGVVHGTYKETSVLVF